MEFSSTKTSMVFEYLIFLIEINASVKSGHKLHFSEQ